MASAILRVSNIADAKSQGKCVIIRADTIALEQAAIFFLYYERLDRCKTTINQLFIFFEGVPEDRRSSTG